MNMQNSWYYEEPHCYSGSMRWCIGNHPDDGCIYWTTPCAALDKMLSMSQLKQYTPTDEDLKYIPF